MKLDQHLPCVTHIHGKSIPNGCSPIWKFLVLVLIGTRTLKKEDDHQENPERLLEDVLDLFQKTQMEFCWIMLLYSVMISLFILYMLGAHFPLAIPRYDTGVPRRVHEVSLIFVVQP